MKRRTSALITLGGVAAAILAYSLFGPGTGPIDPETVRRYREDHPGATISEAAAVAARK